MKPNLMNVFRGVTPNIVCRHWPAETHRSAFYDSPLLRGSLCTYSVLLGHTKKVSLYCQLRISKIKWNIPESHLLGFLVHFNFYLYMLCLWFWLDGNISCRWLFTASGSRLPPGQDVNNPGMLHWMMVSEVNQDIAGSHWSVFPAKITSRGKFYILVLFLDD